MRNLPYLEQSSENSCIRTLKTIALGRPRVEYKSGIVTIIQRVPKRVEELEKELIESLYIEAENLFSVYGFLVTIELEYE